MRPTFDHLANLLRKYDSPAPRYTSYPTAPSFRDDFDAVDYAQLLSESVHHANPLSLYVHVPFCRNVCWFCACNVVYTANRKRCAPYLDLVREELRLVAEHLHGGSRKVKQLHWGGGTPTFLAPEEIFRLYENIGEFFEPAPLAEREFSIELDPRETTAEHVAALRQCGFTRASLGIQDFDADVQSAVHRIQPFELTADLANALRDNGFRSINADLIYGLPLQDLSRFESTLRKLTRIRPDRVSLFHFAYLPELKKHQRNIRAGDLPGASTRLRLFELAVEILAAEGYVHIGMDHFALPGDELAVAQRERRLHRNFQGYTTMPDADLLGFGVSSIGALGGGSAGPHAAYIQNAKDLSDYEARLGRGELPVMRGLVLSEVDRLRRYIINELICHFELQFSAVESRFGGVVHEGFARCFADELRALEDFERDGLLHLDRTGGAHRGNPRRAFRNSPHLRGVRRLRAGTRPGRAALQQSAVKFNRACETSPASKRPRPPRV